MSDFNPLIETRPAVENPEARLKRMRMRSWRRGMKEMDLILGPWADAKLGEKSEQELNLYDQMMGENDQDLYLWVSGARPSPVEYLDLLSEIAFFARERHLKL